MLNTKHRGQFVLVWPKRLVFSALCIKISYVEYWEGKEIRKVFFSADDQWEGAAGASIDQSDKVKMK